MGAGISKERRYRIVYRELHKIQRELAEKGVPSRYKNRSLVGGYDGNLRNGFWIGFRGSNASNGECFLYPIAQVLLDNNLTDYTSVEWMPGPSFRKNALPLILQHFAA